VNLAAADTQAANPAFDVTPARLVRGLVTEHGVFEASGAGLTELQGRL
jgi:methylthioribose-1-phosphate isomerase